MKPFLALGLSWAIAGLIAPGAIAQTALDGDLTLSSSNRSGSIAGTAIGSSDMPSAVLNQPRDQAGNECLGFSSLSPNHRLTLQTPVQNLVLSVNSGQEDTTIAVKGPNGFLLCGDDSVGAASARVTSNLWPAGVYQIWVGTFKAGSRANYRLMAE